MEHVAVAPLAVLAFKLGLTELVDSCADAIIDRCVFYSLSSYSLMRGTEYIIRT